MRTVVRASLRAARRRLLSTGLAITLGVAFLCGTLLLSDTMRASFNDLFTTALGRADVVVRAEGALTTDIESAQALVDLDVAGAIAAIDGVRAVEPRIEGFGQLTGADGEKLGGDGPPTHAGSWIDDPELNPYELVDGRAPVAADEVVINRGAAEEGDLSIGDATTVATPEPVSVTVVGIATFGGADGLGPTTFTGFSFDGAAEHVLGGRPGATTLLVAAEDGVDADALREAIAGVVPTGVEAITGADLADEAVDALDADFLGFLRSALLAFALVALLVAAFSIHNTFAIVVAQRLRESALLRAIGASRRQVLTATVVEAAFVGVVASAIGTVAGVGVAGLLKGVFDAFGFAMPKAGLALRPSSLVVAPVVGIVVALVAAVGPAVRASKVAPLAALRGIDVDRSGASRWRAAVGLVLVLAGVGVAASGALAGQPALAGLGAVALVVGAVVLGPVVVAPVAGWTGAPLGRLRGISGALAGRNAARSPKRTSGTAAALLVGVGVVTIFTVVAVSLKSSMDDRVGDVVTADLVISASQFGGGGLSPGLAGALADVPEVATSVGVASGPVSIDGRTSQISALDLQRLTDVFDVAVTDGALRDDALAVSDRTADGRDWSVGDVVDVRFVDGSTAPVEVGAIFDAADPLLEGILVPRVLWDEHSVQTIDTRVLLVLEDGVDVEAGRRAVEAAAAPFSPPDVMDREELVASAASNIDAMLGLVYVMLALAVVIALMGIANTLSLSIAERSRELGLLRAVGQTRRQVRSMVRWEAVLISLLGTAGGVGLGLYLGWAIVEAVSDDGTVAFALPGAGQLVPIVVVGAVVGILAAVRPARRAARLPVLAAVAG